MVRSKVKITSLKNFGHETKELINCTQLERISRFGRQSATCVKSYKAYKGQDQGQVRSGHQRSSQTTCSMGYMRYMIYGSIYSYNAM